MEKCCYIACKKSSKNEKTYLVLIINGAYVFLRREDLEKVAMTVGCSNIDLSNLREGDTVDIV